MSESTDAWYYAAGETRMGPYPLAELKLLIAAGRVQPATMVWTAGMVQWAPAGSVAALFPIGMPPPVPALPLGYAMPVPSGEEHGLGTRMLIPVGRSGWAIAAGYAGLFATLVIFAPVALILGIIAVVHLRRRSDLHGWGRAIFGLVMGAIFSILLVVGIVAVIVG